MTDTKREDLRFEAQQELEAEAAEAEAEAEASGLNQWLADNREWEAAVSGK